MKASANFTLISIDDEKDVVSVYISVNSIQIPVNAQGKVLADNTVNISFSGFKGSVRKACIATVSGLPNGITSTVTAATTSTDGTIALTIAKDSALGDSLNGLIAISLICESASFSRNISWVKVIDATAIQQELESQGGTIEDLSNSSMV